MNSTVLTFGGEEITRGPRAEKVEIACRSGGGHAEKIDINFICQLIVICSSLFIYLRKENRFKQVNKTRLLILLFYSYFYDSVIFISNNCRNKTTYMIQINLSLQIHEQFKQYSIA